MVDQNKKTISVTLDRWVIKDVLQNPGNRSSRIQELLIKGHLYEQMKNTQNQMAQDRRSGTPGDESDAQGGKSLTTRIRPVTKLAQYKEGCASIQDIYAGTHRGVWNPHTHVRPVDQLRIKK